MMKKILIVVGLLFAVIVLIKNRSAVFGNSSGGGGGLPPGGVGLLPDTNGMTGGHVQNLTGKPLGVSAGAVGGFDSRVVGTMGQSYDQLTQKHEAEDDAYAKGLLTKALSFNVVGLFNDITDGLKREDKKQAERIQLLIDYAKAGDPRAKLQLSVGFPDIAKANGVYAIGLVDQHKGNVPKSLKVDVRAPLS